MNYISCDFFCIDDGLYSAFPYIGYHMHYIMNNFFYGKKVLKDGQGLV